MKLSVIETGKFKLDGGAMFGLVPKVLWNKVYEADENNLCTWAMRCLLVEDGDKLILIDTGMGNKQADKFYKHFYPHGEDTLLGSIKNAGYSPDEITDVVLTHLHFDHCGGAVTIKSNKLVPQFKNAVYYSHKEHWQSACEPNHREKASFLKENFLPLEATGQLQFLEKGDKLTDNIWVNTADGHTEKMLIPYINYKGKTIVYAADLLPSPVHMPMPWVMAYDINPLQTLKEKEPFLLEVASKNQIIFFEHDSKVECCTAKITEKGVRVNECFDLKEIL